MKLLVIIVTYNAMPWVDRCFGSLLNSTVKPDVFVVDNGSSDGTQNHIQEHYPDVIFRQSEKNLGFGKANNRGLQFALDNGYDYVYLLNQDAWVMPDTFERLIEISKQHFDYGILSPFQMNADMYHIDSKFLSRVLAWDSNPEIGSDMYNCQYKDVYPVQTVMAAHWLIPRACLLKVGGFSPSFPHYSEDYNYIDRISYKGMKVGIVPSMRVVHDRGSREDTREKKMYLMYTGFIRSLSNPGKSVPKSLASISFGVMVGMIRFKSLRPLRNLADILFHLHTILKNRKISMSSDCAFLTVAFDLESKADC